MIPVPIGDEVEQDMSEHWTSEEQRLVAEWHRKMGVVIQSRPTLPPMDLARFRAELIGEEADEVECALMTERNDGALEDIVKELADLLYVTYGTAVSLGIDLEPVFRAVHASNLTKDPANKTSHGKVLKGPNYRPPDLRAVLERQGESYCGRCTPQWARHWFKGIPSSTSGISFSPPGNKRHPEEWCMCLGLKNGQGSTSSSIDRGEEGT